MKKIVAIAALAAVVVSLTACGGATLGHKTAGTASSLASSMQDSHWRGNGSLSDVSCIHQQGAVWQCYGTWAPTEAGIKAEYGGPGVHLSRSDVADQIKREIRPMTYQVTVASDGTWIANPN